MTTNVRGYLVVDHAENWEQPLRLIKGDELPPDGILVWRAEPNHAATAFATRADARAAIVRTDHYRLAFADSSIPEKRFCKIVPVEFLAEKEATK